jgi:hypothetical protein
MEESSPSKKFKKKLYHKICQNAKQRIWRNHRHQRSLNKTLSQNLSKRKAENPEESSPSKKFKKNFITKSVKTQSRELGGIIAIKEV